MSATLEVVNLTCLAEWKTDEWKISVERGDLRQEMVVYLGMARRVTLENISTKETVTETFMGSFCGTKANKWLNSMTNGTSNAGMEWLWL
jgi:hypothetical protein